MPAKEQNFVGLARINRELISKAEGVASAPAEPQAGGTRYKGFLNQAESWRKAWRAVAKAEFYLDNLFPHAGFIRGQLGDPQSGGGAFLRQARNGGAMFQGRPAGGEDDRPEPLPIPF